MSPLDGSSMIYHKIILPLFKKNQSKIDEVLNKGKEKMSGYADKMISEASKVASEMDKKSD